MAVYDLWFRLPKGETKRVPTSLNGTGNRWQARWRDRTDTQRKKNFARKDEAEAFLARIHTSPELAASGMTVREGWAKWSASKAHKKPATRRGYEAKWRLYVEPTWGDVRLVNVLHSEAAAWLSKLGARHSSTTARQAWTVFHGIVQLAIKDGVLTGDPCAGVDLPRAPKGTIEPISPAEVDRLREAAGPHSLAVETAVTTGIRWQEMAGLNCGDVDLHRRRLHIARSVGLDDHNQPILQTTKSGLDRWVPLSPSLAARLAAVEGKRDDPLFRTRTGGRWRYRSWHRQWEVIQQRAEVRITPHGLRHTAASIAIAQGANVKQLQAMLGHQSATLTVDRYGHLMGDDGMDELAERIAHAFDYTEDNGAEVDSD